jgi:hypothetical protein
MCILCSSGYTPFHWAEEPLVDAAATAASANQRARRDRFVRADICREVLGHYGVGLRSQTGREYVVTDAKGRMEVAQSLSEVWATAVRFGADGLSPLDPSLIAAMDRG